MAGLRAAGLRAAGLAVDFLAAGWAAVFRGLLAGEAGVLSTLDGWIAMAASVRRLTSGESVSWPMTSAIITRFSISATNSARAAWASRTALCARRSRRARRFSVFFFGLFAIWIELTGPWRDPPGARNRGRRSPIIHLQ